MDGHKETIVQPIMDAPGRKVQRKRKMIPKQRKPEDNLDSPRGDNLKVFLRSAKKPRDSSHIVLTDLDRQVPYKKSGIHPLWEPSEEEFKLLKSKCPPFVGYKGKKMKITEVIQQVIFEVIQRVVKEVAVDIVKDIMDKIVDSAIDSIFVKIENNENKKPDQAKNDDKMCGNATADEEDNIDGVSSTM